MDGSKDGQKEGRTEGRMGGSTKDRQTEGRTDERRCTGGDRRMEIDGRKNAQNTERTHTHTHTHTHTQPTENAEPAKQAGRQRRACTCGQQK